MKILAIGCGSIGMRHVGNFRTLGIKDFILCDTNPSRLKAAGEKFGIKSLRDDYKEALAGDKNITAAVIAAPSSMHVPMAIDCARAGVNLFIEKPLSDSIDGIDKLISIVDEKDLVAMMAMCYRFHPVFLRLEELLDREAIGRLYHINYFGGHYLPDWHPNEDYRKEYAARKDLGGGVILTSIHALDNIRWLFGEPAEIASFADKISGLETDAEDIALAAIKMKSGLYVSLSSDFLQRANQHRMVLVGEAGTIRCDFLTGKISIYSAANKNWREETIQFDVNEMYLSEANHFLKRLKDKTMPETDIKDGVATLRFALALKDSSERKVFVRP